MGSDSLSVGLGSAIPKSFLDTLLSVIEEGDRRYSPNDWKEKLIHDDDFKGLRLSHALKHMANAVNPLSTKDKRREWAKVAWFCMIMVWYYTHLTNMYGEDKYDG